MKKTEDIRIRLTPRDKQMLQRLTTPRTSMSDVVRMLIHKAFHQEVS